jgi:hypothetical protein
VAQQSQALSIWLSQVVAAVGLTAVAAAVAVVIAHLLQVNLRVVEPAQKMHLT